MAVTLPSSERVSGTLDHNDEFNVSPRDSSGDYHSFAREGPVPAVEIHDPLKPHNAPLAKYRDADIHNVTAYLLPLK